MVCTAPLTRTSTERDSAACPTAAFAVGDTKDLAREDETAFSANNAPDNDKP
jgi:hypothetical protein